MTLKLLMQQIPTQLATGIMPSMDLKIETLKPVSRLFTYLTLNIKLINNNSF